MIIFDIVEKNGIQVEHFQHIIY